MVQYSSQYTAHYELFFSIMIIIAALVEVSVLGIVMLVAQNHCLIHGSSSSLSIGGIKFVVVSLFFKIFYV